MCVCVCVCTCVSQPNVLGPLSLSASQEQQINASSGLWWNQWLFPVSIKTINITLMRAANLCTQPQRHQIRAPLLLVSQASEGSGFVKHLAKPEASFTWMSKTITEETTAPYQNTRDGPVCIKEDSKASQRTDRCLRRYLPLT